MDTATRMTRSRAKIVDCGETTRKLYRTTHHCIVIRHAKTVHVLYSYSTPEARRALQECHEHPEAKKYRTADAQICAESKAKAGQ